MRSDLGEMVFMALCAFGCLGLLVASMTVGGVL